MSALYSGDADAVSGVIYLSIPAASNIGVGDEIRVGASRYYVSGRTDATHLSAVTATGATAPDFALQAITIYRAFNTLKGALDTLTGACDINHLNTSGLVGGNYVLNLACYGDGKDSLPAVVRNWTTGINNYVRIFTPVASNEVGVSQRHDGKWNTSAYRLEVTNQMALKISDDHVRVEGLQVSLTTTASFYQGIYVMGTGASTDIRISSNIVKGNISGSSTNPKAIENYSGSVTRIWNNIIYGFTGISGTATGILTDFTTCSTYVYNNTISIGPRTVGIARSAGFMLAKNNLVQSDSLCFSGIFDASSGYNLSNDATAPGASARTSIVPTFVDTAAKDFHLAASDGGAKDYGVDLSADAKLAFSTDIDGTSRSGAWDIGADEWTAPPVEKDPNIYYSVGTNVSALFSGNAWTISKGLIALSSAAANNIGVGDEVRVGGNRYYIRRRDSSTNFRIENSAANGGAPGDTNITFPNQAISVYRAFNSLSAAEAGASDANHLNTADIVTGNYVLNIACYGDGTDATGVVVGGWTTGVNNYIRIFTPVAANEVGISQRHAGVWSTTGKYYMSVSGSIALRIAAENVRVEGLQIGTASVAVSSQYGLSIEGAAGVCDYRISNCLLKGTDAGANTMHLGIYLAAASGSAGSTLRIWNNIIYNYGPPGTFSHYAAYFSNSNCATYFYNNTVFNCSHGINAAAGTVIAKNNIVTGITQSPDANSYVGTFAAGTDYNATNSIDATGVGANNRTGQAFSFVSTTPGSEDLHLHYTDAGAKNYGADLSSDANLPSITDIDGAARTSPWCLGADENDVTVPTSPTINIMTTFTNDTDPAISLSATGADSMRLGQAADTAAAVWKAYGTIDSINISTGGDGLKRVFAQYKNLAGARTAWVYDSVTYDGTAPTSFSINVIPVITKDPDPALTLSATEADSMRIAVEADTASATWRLYNTSDSLSVSVGGEGVKRVYAQYKDLAGNRTAWVYDSVTYDVTAPTSFSVNVIPTLTNDPDPAVTLAATGADSMRIAVEADTGSAVWKLFNTNDSVSISAGGDVLKRVFAQFKDLAGNKTGWVYDSVNYDGSAPTAPPIDIIATLTNDPDPAISIAGSSADSMRLALEADTATATWRPYNTSDSISIVSGGDGFKRVFAQYKDLVGNRTVWMYDSVTYDGTAPTPTSVTITDYDGYTNDSQPDLTISATGADSMAYKLDAGAWSSFEMYNGSKTNFDISAGGEGPKTVYIMFKDQAGNATDGSLNDITNYDVSAPTGGTISIAGGNAYTTVASVTLTLSAADADSMAFSEDDVSYTSYENYITSKPGYVLSGGDGAKTVYVRYKDAAGNVATSVSDNIILDTQAPTGGTISVASGADYTTSGTVNIDVTATAADSMAFSLDDITYDPYEMYNTTKAGFSLGTEGAKTVYVKFKDEAGNEASSISDGITYDATAPTAGTISVASGAVYTSSGTVNIDVTATAADSMSFSLDDITYDPYEMYNTTKTGYSLGTEGAKIVYVKFKDAAGNEASSISDGITYDATAPSNTGTFAATYLAGDSIRLTWTASASADVESVMVRYNTGSYPTTTSSGTLLGEYPGSVLSDTAIGLAEKTTYYFVAFTKDSVGNWSDTSGTSRDSAAIPDLTPPANVTSLDAIALDSSNIRISWTPSVSADAESILVRYDTTSVFPADSSGGLLWARLSHTVTSDTLYGLVSKKWYRISLFVKDSAGLWSVGTASARDSAKTPDGTPPTNVTGFTANHTGSGTVALSWTPSVSADKESLVVVYRTNAYPTNQADGTLLGAYGAGVSLDTAVSLAQVTTYYFAAFVKDSSGNWSTASAGSFDTAYVPDYTPPSAPSVNVIAAATNDATPTIALSASGITVGIDSMRVALLADTGTATWKPYATVDSIDISAGGDSLKRVFAQYKDLAGNRSAWVYDSVTYDATAPSAVTINIIATLTTDADPAISLSAAGADSMRLGQDTTTATWKLYSTSDSVNVGGSDGLKRVYVQFKDYVGNKSAWIYDSVTYDGTAPTGSTINIIAILTNDADPAISLSATGADSMRLGQDTTTATWKLYSTTDSVNIGGSDGLKKVYVQFKDYVGNKTAWISDSVTYDGTAPTAPSINIIALLTNDADPRITLSATGSPDSMRLGQDTTTATWKLYSTTDSVNIGGSDGLKKVYVQFKDYVGNKTAWVVDSVTYDGTAPSGTTINIIATLTNDADPAITLGATDADSMRLGQAADTASAAWKMYSTSDSVNISAGGDGLKRAYVQYKDLAGNRSAWVYDSVSYDAGAPTSGTISIAAGAVYTTSATVTLALFATGADSMSFSQDNVTYSSYEVYATSKAGYALTGGEGVNTVYVKYKDATGNVAVSVSDNITYDATAPTSPIVNIAATLTIDADPMTSLFATGADSMRLGQATDTASAAWRMYSTSDSINIGGSDGLKKVYVQYKDLVGNRTAWVYDSVTYDATAPTGTTINIIASLTTDADPAISLSATGADSMRLGQAADTTSATWKAYATSDSINISGSDGVKRVYVQYKDQVGNRSAWVSDSVTFDGTMPSGSINIIATLTKDADPRLSISASGADSMRIAVAADTFAAAWKPVTSTDSISIVAGGDGIKRIFAQFKDNAGNRSAWVLDSVTYDGTAPSVISIDIPVALTLDADPAIVLSAIGADSLRFAMAGDTAAAMWKSYRTLDSINLSAGGSGLKKVFAQFKDLAGNRSAWVIDSVTYDGSVPSGSINIIAMLTNDADPVLALSAVNADSMRVAVTSDTGAAAWRVYRTSDSIAINVGGDGVKKVFAQFKNIVGTRSAWVSDSVDYDGTAPSAISINVIPALTNDADPALLMSATGASHMRVALAADTSAAVWKAFASNDSVIISAGGDGVKRVFAQYKDPAGNMSSWVSDSMTYDATAPSGSLAIVDDGGVTTDSTPAFTITVNSSADSMRLWLNTASVLNGGSWRSFRAMDSLPLTPGGNRIYAQLKDMAGNVGAVFSDSTYYDCIAPSNLLTLSADVLGPNAVQLAWDPSAMAGTDADSVVVLMRAGDTIRSAPDANVSIAVRKAIGDSIVTLSNLSAHTQYSFALIVRDLRGNWSGIAQAGRATVTTPSSAPLVTAWADTVISEKASYSYQVQAQDEDGDSLVYSLRSAPSSMTLTPAGIVSWAPGNSDVGKQVASIRVADLFGAWADIACTLDVRNVNDAPDVRTVSGIRTVNEDRAYAETLAVIDPDVGDSLTLSTLALPSWISLSRLTKPSSTEFALILSGVPANGSVGDTSIALVVSDYSGASDTFACVLKVLNTNDAPVILTEPIPARAFEDSLFALTILAGDADAQDSLTAVLAAKPAWLNAGRTTVVAGQVTVELSGKPTQADTGKADVVVVVFDKAAAADTLRFTLEVLDMNDGPETRIDTIMVTGGAARIRFSGVDDYTTALSYRYRLSDSTGVIDSGETASLVKDFYPLVDGRYQVTIQAVDSARSVDQVPAVGSFAISGVLVREFDDSSWIMLSAPATSLSPDVLGGKVHLSRWQDDASADAVYEKYQGKAKIASIGAGEGYWAWLGQKATVRLNAGNLVRTPQAITLRNGGEGWNQIGNPFCYPVRLADSTLKLWAWNELTQGYVDAGSRMEPWVGYWIQVDSAMQMAIQGIPDFNERKSAVAKRTNVANVNAWRLQLVAGAAGSADGDNFFGVSPAAKIGYDRSDYAEPPSMGDRVATFFVHEDWQRPVAKYAVDMRAPGPITHEWQFAVSRPASSPNSAQISIAGLESLPKEYQVYLFDRGVYTDLRKQAAYPCSSSHNPSYYRIIATQDPKYLEKVTAGYGLAQNFPNPCNPVTVIRYSVPQSWRDDGRVLSQTTRVRLSIYDCAGRLVIDLVNGAALPGRYEAVWKGQDRFGKGVSSGTYFYRMQAPGFHGAKKLVLLK